jgi:hypothetical protein
VRFKESQKNWCWSGLQTRLQHGYFGYVRYIVPGSDAATKDIQRGTIFYGINGTPQVITNLY